jgi:mono/diheme cytochrome c family protein
MPRTVACTIVALVIAGCGGGAAKDNEAGQKGPTSTNGGGGGNANASAGRTLFAAKCGTCHTLKAAGTGGTFGPNLDDLKPDKQTVLHQIANGGGGMPAKLYSGAQAAQVAAYVSSAAGNG